METAKKMKLALSLWVLFFTMAGATGTQANTHRHYFPLNVGNSWTYVNSEDGSTKTFTIIGAQEINGHTYYKFDDYVRVCGYPGGSEYPDDDMLFRYDSNTDKVLQYRSSTNEDLVRYDFSGNRWPDGYGSQLIETGVSCTVPAGQFDNCCIFEFAMTVDCGEFYETLAPGVGNVEFIEFSSSQGHFKLQDYTGGWLPEDIEIVPENPTSADVVDITFSGNWPDSCIPTGSNVRVDGSDIYFEVFEDTSGACWAVITPWEQTQSVGPLSPGRYTVYAALVNPMEAVIPQYTQVARFNVAETNTYVFVPGQSTLVKTGGPVWVHESYTIEGWFQLTFDLDANTASLDDVYGDLYYDGVPLDTTLDILLRMTEMISTSVSDTSIVFESNSLPGGITGELTFTFEESDSVHLTGNFSQALQYPFNYELDAVARKKIVSDGVSWIAGESGPADWKVEPNYASTSDVIHFFGPTAVFGNSCSADASVGGTPTLITDPVNKTIELWFQPPPPYMCPQVYDPVCGLEGSFGPLEAGQWLFFGNDPNGTFSILFQVDSAIDSNSIVDNGIKYYMQTDKSVYKLDEQVEMLYRVTNLTPNSVDIGNILNCEDAWTHFAITDYDDTDIWQFFRINPPCGYVMFSLDPYESRECQMVWDMTNDNGTLEPEDDFPVGPGLYNITGELELGGGYQRVPVSVTIEIIPFVYVDADATGADDGSCWADAYTSLPYALDVVLSGYGIRVAQGAYRPNDGVIGIGDERELTFQLKNDVTVKGGYAGFGEPDPHARDIETYETILSGDLYGNDGPDFANNGDNSYHVVTGSGTDATAVLDGFTITGGNAPYGGGGMYNYEGDPRLTNCTFISNSAEYLGGGMYNYKSSPAVTNCTFSGNSGGGGGGGMTNRENSSPTVTNCIFSENSAPGVFISGGGGGGMYNDTSSPIVTNCIFSGNSAAGAGGGISNWWGANPTISNCTFSDNSAAGAGGMHNYVDCSPTITNCILWGDTPNEMYTDSGTPTVTYSDVQGGWEGLGNIDVDPLFADPCDGDYHLKSEGWRWSKYIVHGSHWWCDYVTSPCIDAGNPGSPLGNELLTIPDDPSHDWGENIRINMGAYGGTAQASMPPYGWALLGDLSNDGIVDYEDLAGQIEDWLTTASQQPGDLNRDGIVKMADFALLAQDWLQMTDGVEFVNFADYWPFAVGNRWDSEPIPDFGFTLEITDRFFVNGFEIWEFTDWFGDFGGGHVTTLYYVYVNGFLYATENLTDLDNLPEVSGDLQPQYPEVVQLNVLVDIPGLGLVMPLQGSLTSVLENTNLTPDDFPLGDQADVLAFIGPGLWDVTVFGRNLGPTRLYEIFILDAVIIE